MVAKDSQNIQRLHLVKFITWLFGHNYLLKPKVLNLILFILKSVRDHSLFFYIKHSFVSTEATMKYPYSAFEKMMHTLSRVVTANITIAAYNFD